MEQTWTKQKPTGLTSISWHMPRRRGFNQVTTWDNIRTWKLQMAHGGSWKTKRIGAGVFTNSQVRLDCYKMSDVSDLSNPFVSTQMRAMSRGSTFSTIQYIQYGCQSNQKHKNLPWCTCLVINFWFGKCPKSWIQITFAMTKAVNFQIFVGHDFNAYIFLLILNVCWLNLVKLYLVVS